MLEAKGKTGRESRKLCCLAASVVSRTWRRFSMGVLTCFQGRTQTAHCLPASAGHSVSLR